MSESTGAVEQIPVEEPDRRRRRLASALLAVAFAAAFVALYTAAVLTPQGQFWDAQSLGTFGEFRTEDWLAVYEARDWLPFALLGLGAIAGIEGIIRRRWVAVVASSALVGLTALAGYTFKGGVLPRPYLGEFAYTYQTFPSGHVAMSLAAVVAMVWFAPRWLHPIVLFVLGAVIVLVAVASLLSFAHRASDVVAGGLLAGAIAFAISAIVGLPPSRIRWPRLAWSVAGGVALVACAVVYAMLLAGDGAEPDIDVIAVVAIVAVAGVTAVVLANQSAIDASGSVPADAPSA
ncbi:hypothetical protein GCM10009775_10310 [Microbacterium aoyamense]|uniref:Phosphatidic acid phosphatase type 2/haloperoxidase domain-containing protein n=1 Tax=Microbacterium aoyamense TaxID=344166 RepID=A0ABP5AQB8_9MICO|nr:phosphatase PAP2 family protein [Microbacterium aoyamense]